MSGRVPPSGAQFPIAYGDARAVVVEVGGGVREYVAGGVAVLDGYAETEICDGARGQPLGPWPNRVRDGRYSWDGVDYTLALTEPEQNNAIHGFLRFVSWRPAEHQADRVRMEATIWPQVGYPFTVVVTVDYGLDRDGLTVRTTAHNVGNAAAPWGHGAHPYLCLGAGRIDDLALQLPAGTWLPTGDQQAPTGEEPVAGTPYDFRSVRSLGDTVMDYAFGSLQREADGRAVVRVSMPDGRRSAQLWVDETYPYIEVFTGDTLPDPARRRLGLGLEPMTCPPNGFQTGTGVIRLEPGGTWSGAWGIRPWEV